jgi:hypothetical protein
VVKKLFLAIKVVAAMVCAIFLFGLWIGSLKVMPDHSKVCVDDVTKTYIAPPCVKESDGLRIVNAGEAKRLGYEPDKRCRDEGAFIQDDRSLTGLFFQKIGILRPIPSRWNEDGSWNY